MSRKQTSGLGGAFAAEQIDAIKDEYRRDRALLRSDLLADGYPPTAAKLPAREQLRRLEGLMATGDPRSLTPEAQQARDRLRKQVQG